MPTLRHVNYVALHPDGKTNGELCVHCTSREPRYHDLLRCRLIDSGGQAVAVSKAAPGQTLKLDVPAGAGNLMALEVISGQSLASAHFPPHLPWALVARRESEETFSAFLRQSGVKTTRAGSTSAEGIRLATYRSPDWRRLIVHAVNYLTPLGVDAPPVEEAKENTVILRIPRLRTYAVAELTLDAVSEPR